MFSDACISCETIYKTLVYDYLYALFQYFRSTASIFIEVKSSFYRRSI